MRSFRFALVALLLGGCYPSNVLDESARRVERQRQQVAWRPAHNGDRVEGYYRSTGVSGPVAANLVRVYYYFEADGRYTGAALVAGADGLAFQTLAGGWALHESDKPRFEEPPSKRVAVSIEIDGARAELWVAPNRLRLVTQQGTLELESVELE
ncbi:MAG: hypothetical protein AAF488_09000 [Planctomycetota bacterium]